MNLQYKKHKGLLYTVNDCSEAAIDALERNPYSIEKAKYQEAEFATIVSAASGIKIKETWLTDGVKRRNDKVFKLTAENLVVSGGKLFGVLHTVVGANYQDLAFATLEKLSKPYLIDSQTYYFDEPGDHDSWTTEIFLEIKKQEI